MKTKKRTLRSHRRNNNSRSGRNRSAIIASALTSQYSDRGTLNATNEHLHLNRKGLKPPINKSEGRTRRTSNWKKHTPEDPSEEVIYTAVDHSNEEFPSYDPENGGSLSPPEVVHERSWNGVPFYFTNSSKIGYDLELSLARDLVIQRKTEPKMDELLKVNPSLALDPMEVGAITGKFTIYPLMNGSAKPFAFFVQYDGRPRPEETPAPGERVPKIRVKPHQALMQECRVGLERQLNNGKYSIPANGNGRA